MSQITVTLDADIARETLIALNEWRWNLIDARGKSEAPAVRDIIARQLDRIDASIRALQEQVGERWI